MEIGRIEELKIIYRNTKEGVRNPYKPKERPEYSEPIKCNRPYVLT